MELNPRSKLDRAIKILTRGLIIILPLFFLPLASSRIGQDSFNKAYLLIFLAGALLLLCLVRGYRAGEWKIFKSWLYIPVGLFLFATGLAAAFSVDPYASFFGSAGMASYSYLALVSIILFSFFLFNNVSRYSSLYGILQSLIIGYLIAVYCTVMALFSYWIGFVGSSGLVSGLIKKAFGSFEDLAMYIGVMSVMAIGIYFNSGIKEKILRGRYLRGLVWLAVALSFFLLVLINFIYAWWAVMLGNAVIFLALLVRRGGLKSSKLLWPLLFVIIPLVFTLFNYQISDKSLINRRLARSLVLDRENSLIVAKEAIKKHPILGFGQNAFTNAFSRYRSPSLNNSPYWYLRFNEPGSGIINLGVSAGLLGIVAFLSLLAFTAFKVFKSWLKDIRGTKKREGDSTSGPGARAVLTGALVSLIAAYFMYPANLTLSFLFFVVLAMLASVTREKSKDGEIRLLLKSGNLSLAAIFFVFVLTAGWVTILALTTKDWVAAAYFQNGEAGEAGLVKAAELNPRRTHFHTALAKHYKDQALKALEGNERDRAAILINKSVDSVQEAIKYAPLSVAALETAGIIYRDISDYSPDSRLLAIAYFEQAIALEPTNPVLWTELGKMQHKNQEHEKAIDSLKRAVELKNNYEEAQFNLAKAYIDSEHEAEALAILSRLEKKQVSAELYYEQGRAHYNIDKYDAAIGKFQAALNLSPLHSNALYSLAMSYEALDDAKSALYYYKKVSEINSENEDVKEKIKFLEEE